MKSWFIGIGIGILAISRVLATVARVWAMSASPGGEPITPAFQRAGTGVRFLLGLAVAATLGVPFWLAVLVTTLVPSRVWHGAKLDTDREGSQSSTWQFPIRWAATELGLCPAPTPEVNEKTLTSVSGREGLC
jgi:hypothetical protein